MATDIYRQRVYDAENELRFMRDHSGGSVDFYGQLLELPEVRKFGTLANVQAYVNAVYDLRWVRDKYPTENGPPTVSPRAGGMAAHYERGTHKIKVPDHVRGYTSWAMNEIVILHEIAHALTPGDYDTGDHGTEFCLAFMDLLEGCLGGAWKLLLMRALDTRGVPLA